MSESHRDEPRNGVLLKFEIEGGMGRLGRISLPVWRGADTGRLGYNLPMPPELAGRTLAVPRNALAFVSRLNEGRHLNRADADNY